MAKAFKRDRVLFFIIGSLPTEEDMETAEALNREGADVVYRNAVHVPADANVEACEPFDDVAGEVPDCYRRAKERKARMAEDEASRPAPAVADRVLTRKRSNGRAAPPVGSVDPAAASALAVLSGGEAPPPAWKPNS